MLFRKKTERIEPHFDRPTSEELTFRFDLDDQGRTVVYFERHGVPLRYFRATYPVSAYQMVLQGLRKLAQSEPEATLYVIDETGGYVNWLTHSPISGARRTIQDVPHHVVRVD